MSEIVDTAERLLESEFNLEVAYRRMRLPRGLSDIAQIADASLQAFGIYHQKIHVLSEMNRTIAASFKKAEHELGYRPLVDLKEGMRPVPSVGASIVVMFFKK